MADPFSTTVSAMTVFGFAAQSSKVLFKFFRGVASLPSDVKESLRALESLHLTLINLQQSGAKLGPTYTFPPHLCHRLNECLNDLTTLETRIGKINAEFSEKGTLRHSWSGKARRSWERVRWPVVGEQELRKFLQKVKSYQAEFVLELLTLLM